MNEKVPVEKTAHDGAEIPLQGCPTCGYQVDAATLVQKLLPQPQVKRPRPGDFSVCFSCGEMLRFTDAMTLRICDLNDMVGLTPRLGAYLSMVQNAVRKERPLTNAPHITCPVCHRTSYNPNDIREGYCGHCHAFTKV
jgi:hypothetical protein